MKLIIFDLDGTLFNTVPVNYASYTSALGECGYSLDYDYFKEFCNGRFYKEFLPDIVGEDVTVMEMVHKRKVEIYGDYLNKAIPNNNLLYMANLIKDKAHTAIVTTASRVNTIQLLEYFKCMHFFEKVFTREDFERNKPDPEGFLLAMDYFKAEGKETLIFEDSDVGVEAAKRSGADCCIVTGYR